MSGRSVVLRSLVLRSPVSRLLSSLALLALATAAARAQDYAGQVIADVGIADGRAGFVGPRLQGIDLGCAVAALGDLDGDGVTELAVGSKHDGGTFSDPLWSSGSIWILFLARDGSVKAQQKISALEGGLVGPLHVNNRFGSALASLGDLDGDGVPDVAVGAENDGLQSTSQEGKGAVFILFLNADGTVKAEQKIAEGVGGFTGPLGMDDNFGNALDTLGDLDGDGVLDLVVGAFNSNDGSSDRGAVWILFLHADGTVKAQQKISSTSGGFTGQLKGGDRFGAGVGGMGDLDADGIADLCVGATGDDDGAGTTGACWMLFLNADGTVKSHLKIGATYPDFPVTLGAGDIFGSSVHALADLDGDGFTEVAIGASSDDDAGTNAGSVWILFLGPGGALHGMQKINGLEGGFGGSLAESSEFGAAVCALGDLDGDGAGDLCVGATGDTLSSGSAWLLYLRASPWIQIGHGLAGTAGVPVLKASGTLVAGDAVSLQLASAKPLSATTLIVGLTPVFGALKGGMLVPQPSLLVLGSTNAQGSQSLVTPWPPGVPSGTRLWMQQWIADSHAIKGFAASNAVLATTP